MAKYRVAQVGVGHRGRIHADAFLHLSDRYELAGLCDLGRKKMLDYEILEGLCISALDRVRVPLPLDASRCRDVFARMRNELPDIPTWT